MVNQLAVRLRYAVALAGRYPLLAGADLECARGEILVLKGANGAGKTSLLRVVAGLLPLAAGEATVLGLDPTSDARSFAPAGRAARASPTACTRTSQPRRTCALPPGQPGCRRRRQLRPSNASASGSGS